LPSPCAWKLDLLLPLLRRQCSQRYHLIHILWSKSRPPFVRTVLRPFRPIGSVGADGNACRNKQPRDECRQMDSATRRSRSVRVLLVGMPRMLMDIVKGIIADEDDIELAGEVVSRTRLEQVATQTRTDVVVLGKNESSDNDDYRDLLYRRPRLKVL